MWCTQRFVAEDTHERDGITYKIRVARVDEDGHLRVYISTGVISNVMLQGDFPAEAASDIKHQGTDDPVAALISMTKDEIDAGRVHLE